MKLAMPYKQGQLIDWDEADLFVLYSIENNQVNARELHQTTAQGEQLVEELYRLQVNRVMVLKLSDDLKFDLDYFKIEAITGLSGETDELIERFLEGAFEHDEESSQTD